MPKIEGSNPKGAHTSKIKSKNLFMTCKFPVKAETSAVLKKWVLEMRKLVQEANQLFRTGMEAENEKPEENE